VKFIRIGTLNIVLLAAAVLAGCSDSPAPTKAAGETPAKLTGTAVKESELTSVSLSSEAENRLGIRVQPAATTQSAAVHRFAGEIVKPAGSSLIVSSPLAGVLDAESSPSPELGSSLKQNQVLFRIRPLLPVSRDVVVTVEGDVAQARTRVDTARQRKARADRMLADEVGTVRGQEEAQYELDAATAALRAAENRLKQIQSAPLDGPAPVEVRSPQSGVLRQLFVTAGQTVGPGAQMFEVEDTRDVWIRVPVYAGEVQNLNPRGSVIVQAIGGEGGTWTAEPINAPPSADASSATVHLYYRLPNQNLRFKPGEKLNVTIRGNGQRNWVEVSVSAVVYDIHGGSWVYESLGSRRYARRRVDLDHTASGKAFLRAGLEAGTDVVVDGAAELWGFEFGTGK